MSLNIKNDQAHALAIEIASHTGESLTSAVVVALQERLERLEGDRDVAEKKRRVRELLDSLPPRLLASPATIPTATTNGACPDDR